MYIPYLFVRRLLAFFLPALFIRMLPINLQTRLWYKIHGPLKNLKSSPRVSREYTLARVIFEAMPKLRGRRASILEFGVASGTLSRRLLHFAQCAGARDGQIVLHGFDTFEGMPKSSNQSDFLLESWEGRKQIWAEGSFRDPIDNVSGRLIADGFKDFQLHKGLFSDTLTEEVLAQLKEYPPILVVVDCDYYTSTIDVFRKILPSIPNGCVFYFDDVFLNYYSSRTGEMRAIAELNEGVFGSEYELVEAYDLGLLGRRFWRFFNGNAAMAEVGEAAERSLLVSDALSPAVGGETQKFGVLR